jgi:hypothetical protein
VLAACGKFTSCRRACIVRMSMRQRKLIVSEERDGRGILFGYDQLLIFNPIAGPNLLDAGHGFKRILRPRMAVAARFLARRDSNT